MTQTGRNEPCPCGSGKKYKKCCLQKEHVPPGRDAIKRCLNQKLLRLFEEVVNNDKWKDALIEFWGDFDPSTQLSGDALAMAGINFNEWIVHDWVDGDTGKSLIDLYIETSRVLPLAERNVLEIMRSSVLSLFEVWEVFPDKGLLLKDLLLGGEHDVREKAATASLKKWDIFAARILELDGQKILSGAVYPYPLNMKEDILRDYRSGSERYHGSQTELTMRDFMKEMGGRYCNFHWYDIIENYQMPQLTNTEGHRMVVARALYEVSDKKKALNGLRTMKDLDEHEDGSGFAWLGKRDRDGRATVLGTVYFEKERLVLEANSRERLTKGKMLFKKHVPGVVHQVDAFEDIDRHLESWTVPHKERPNDIPFEVQEQLYTEYMDSHYRQWLKDRIPALGGKTPRQAMRTKKGRQQVIDLLKQIENMEEHNRTDGQSFYDVSWIWNELGIEPED